MSEESQYTALVPEYLNRSRMPVLSRYRDLITYVKAAFSDGNITPTELATIEMIEKDILLEYQIAADVFSKMSVGTPEYAPARKLLNHLHRCNVFMRFARDQARLKYVDTNQKNMNVNMHVIQDQKQKRVKRATATESSTETSSSFTSPVRDKKQEILASDQKVIQFTTQMMGLELLKQLDNQHERIQAELPQIRRDLARLSPEERAELEARLSAMIDQIRDRQLEHLTIEEMNRIIGLEKYLMEERERVRDS